MVRVVWAPVPSTLKTEIDSGPLDQHQRLKRLIRVALVRPVPERLPLLPRRAMLTDRARDMLARPGTALLRTGSPANFTQLGSTTSPGKRSA